MALGLYDESDPIYQTSQQARAGLPVYGGSKAEPPPAATGLQAPDFAPPQPAAPPPPPPPSQSRNAELESQGFVALPPGGPPMPGNAPMAKTAREQELENMGFLPVPMAPPPSDKSNFRRGLETSWEQLKQTGAGAVALVGDTFGLDSMRNWGLEKYQSVSKNVEALSSDNDDIFNAMSKDGSFTDWLGYAAGYTVGQAAQMVAGGGVGGIIGKALLQKGTQKFAASMIQKKTGEMLTESLIAKGLGEKAAETKAAEMIAQNAVPEAIKNKAVGYTAQMAGAGIASFGMNATQELGSVYGDAVEQAAKSGVPVSLAKVWVGGAGAALLDTFTDMGAIGRVLHGAGHGSNILGRVAKAGTAQALKEAGTEGIQTLMERWGAQKSMADAEAWHDVINSAAMGAVGGGMAGAAAGVTGRSAAAQKLREQGLPQQQGPDVSQIPEGDVGDVTLGQQGQRPLGLPAPGEGAPGLYGRTPSTPTEQQTSPAEQENAERWEAREQAERNRVLYGHLSDADAAAAANADDVGTKIAAAVKAGDKNSVKAGIDELVGNAQTALNSIGARPDIYATLGQVQASLDHLTEQRPDVQEGVNELTGNAGAALGALGDRPGALSTVAQVAAETQALAPKSPKSKGLQKSAAAAVAAPTVSPTVTPTVTPTDSATAATTTKKGKKGANAGAKTAIAAPATAIAETPVTTTPEPQGDIGAQIAAMVDPKNPKDSVFIATGTAVPALPPGVVRVHKPEGVYLTTDARKARAIAGTASLTDEQRAAFLGIPESKAAVAAQTTEPIAITGKDKAGNVVAQAAAAALVSPNTDAVKSQTPADGTVVATHPVTALAERQQKLALEGEANATPPAANATSVEPVAATKAKATSKKLEAQAAQQKLDLQQTEEKDAVSVGGATEVLQRKPGQVEKAGRGRQRMEPSVEGKDAAKKDEAPAAPKRTQKVNAPLERDPDLTITGTDSAGNPATLKVWTEGDKIVRAEQHSAEGSLLVATKGKDTLARLLTRVEDDFTPAKEKEADVKTEEEGTPPGEKPAKKTGTADSALKKLRRNIHRTARKVAGRTIAEDATREEREANVNAHLAPDWGMERVVTLVDTPPKWQGMAQILGHLLGQNIQFFSPANKQISDAIDGFKVPGDPDTVYVNINHTKPATFIIGHEIGHNIREITPKLWNDFMKVVAGLSDQKAFAKYLHGFNVQLQKEAAARGEARPTQEQIGATATDEWSADALGTAFADPKFWDTLWKAVDAEHKPLVKRMMEEVAAYIKLMLEAIRERLTDVNVVKRHSAEQQALFTDVRKLHRAARDLLMEFRKIAGDELPSKELEAEAAAYYDQKMEPDEAEGHYTWAKLSEQGRDYWVEMYDLFRTGDIDEGELLGEFEKTNVTERRNRINEIQSGAKFHTAARAEAERVWDDTYATDSDPDFVDLSNEHKNHFVRAIHDKKDVEGAFVQIKKWRAEARKGMTEEEQRTADIAAKQERERAAKEAAEKKERKKERDEAKRLATIKAWVEKERPQIVERMKVLSPREQEIVNAHFGTQNPDEANKKLALLVARMLVDPKPLVRALPDMIRPVVQRIVGGAKYSRAMFGTDVDDKVRAAATRTTEGAQAIAAMTDDVRDNTELGDFPGGGSAYNLYEAKKLLPRSSDKVKRVSDDNSFSLYQDYHAIANVDGVLYGISKYEDPDATSDEEDRHGDPKEFLYSYKALDNPLGPDTDTHINDPKELVAHIRAAPGVQYSRASMAAKLSGADAKDNPALAAIIRGNARTEPRITSTGKIVGAPPGKTSVADRERLVNKLTRLLEHPYAVFEKSKNWYEDSGREIARLTEGDPVLREKLARMVAFFSAGATVGANTTFSVRAIAQAMRGEPIQSGMYPNMQSPVAQEIMNAPVMDTTIQGVDNKLMSFYRNLNDAASGEDNYDNASTLDRWMMRLFGYKHSEDSDTGGAQSLSTPQYEYGKDLMHRVSDRWFKQTKERLLPRQVQAALWTYVKNLDTFEELKDDRETAKKGSAIYHGLVERKEELDLSEKDVAFYQEFADDMDKKHAKLEKQIAEFQPVSLSYKEYFDKATARVNYEVRPSTSVDAMKWMHDLSRNDMREVSDLLREVLLDKNGRDELLQKVGLQLYTLTHVSQGTWDNAISPNFVSYAIQDMIAGKTKGEPTEEAATEEEDAEEGDTKNKKKKGEWNKAPLNLYADALGYLFRQDSVFWFRPDKKGPDQGMTARFSNAPDNIVDLLYAEIRAQTPHIELTRDGNEVIFVNTATHREGPQKDQKILSDNKFKSIIRDALQKTAGHDGVRGTVDISPFRTEANFLSNDWSDNPNGEDYRTRIAAAGRSDLLAWLDGKRGQIDSIATGYAVQRRGRVQYSRKAESAGSDQAEAGRLPERGGVRRSAESVDGESGAHPRHDPIQGLPRYVEVDGQRVEFGPHAPAQRAAQAYMEKAGLDYQRPAYQKLDRVRARRIAQAFADMAHAPDDPLVQESYAALKQELAAQWRAVKASGLKVDFIQGADPYGNPRNAILDVVNNNHLWVYPTDSGFGSDAEVDVSNNPLLEQTGEKINGHPVRYNDLFRIVHDYFGHVKEGIGFRAEGEDNAWRQHAAMFSDAALPAITTETRGQNSWVNFGPQEQHNATASGGDTVYADQKVGLLPSWAYADATPQEEPVQRAARVSYSRKDMLNPIEVYAMRGNKIVGMATWNVPNQRWYVYKAFPGGDIRQQYSEHGAATTEDALNLLRDKGVRLIRRKESPLMQGQHDTWARGPDALLHVDTTPAPAKSKLVKGIDRILDGQQKGRGAKLRQYLQREFQDAYIDLKTLQQNIVKKGGIIDAANNVYQKVTLWSGKTGNVLETFSRKFSEPLQDAVVAAMKKGATMKDIETWLIARHAKERNAMIAQRTGGRRLDGSGVSNVKAAQQMRAYASAPYAAELAEIGRISNAISEYKVNLMESSGLISHDVAAGLRSYQNYVPLKGLDEDDTAHITGGMGVGRGFSGKATLLKYALGRDTEAQHVISHLLLDAEAKIIRAGKNEVSLSLAKLAEDHPDPKFWTVNVMKTRQVFDPESGTIKYQADNDFANPNIITAWQNGQKIRIELKDDSFAQAMTNAGAAGSNVVFEMLRKWNRYLAMMMTSLNPEWGLVNAARDAQTAFFNLQSDSTLPPGTSKKVLAELLALGNGTHKDIYRAITDPDHPAGLGRWYKELEAEGGITKFFSLETLKDRADKLKALEDRLQNKGLWNKAQNLYDKSLVEKGVRWLEDANATVEAAPRVITYKVLVEQGWSKERAADYAKNLTVNFNRKGANNVMSSMYLFFNPAIQGTARLGQALQTPAGKGVAVGLFGLGFIAGMTGNAGGDDDKNGIPDYQQLSDWERSTNIIPFAHGPKVPLPYGWNVFYALGNYLSDAFYGRSPMSAAWASIKAAENAFNPVGGGDSKSVGGWFLKSVSPTVIDPLLDLGMNESRFGGPIARQQDSRFGPKQPAAAMGGMGASAGAKILASALGRLGGGDSATIPKFSPFDVNPDQIDYFFGSVAPGALTTGARGLSTVKKLASDEPTEAKDWPVARRVYAEPSKGKVYEALNDAKQDLGEMLNVQKNGTPEQRSELAKTHPGWAGIAQGFEYYGKQVGDLQKRKAGIIDGKIKVADEVAEKTKIDKRVMDLNNLMLQKYNDKRAHWQ